jgi:peptide/nickel transport system permease protein
MYTYFTRRLVHTGFTIWGVTIVIFLLLRMVPGTIIDSTLGAYVARNPELVDKMKAFFGLDQPLYVQYLRWMGGLLTGDLGTSWRASQPVLKLIEDSLPVTLELTFFAILMTILFGVPLGVVSAVKKDHWIDHVGRTLSFVSLGLPNFWLGAMTIIFVSKVFNWLPPLEFKSFTDNPRSNLSMIALPAIALATANLANVVRLTRSAMLETLNQDYVRTARAKGLSETVVVWRHALRNSLIAIVTLLGLMTAYLFGGAVTVEAVFNLPGIGRLVLWSIYQRDYPVTQATLLLVSILFILTNFFVDILYGLINPQIRDQYA